MKQLNAKIVFGNELLKVQKLVVKAAHHQIRLANECVVAWHTYKHKDEGTSDQLVHNHQPTQPGLAVNGAIMKFCEPVDMQPVVRDDMLFIPVGQSKVVPA